MRCYVAGCSKEVSAKIEYPTKNTYEVRKSVYVCKKHFES